MSGKGFLDTNVLVYAQDGRYPAKQRQARSLATRLIVEGTGVISTQVLQEFHVAATTKLGVDPLAAKAVMRAFSAFETVQISAQLVEDAVDCSVLNRISFWDALIVVAAASAGCTTLYSEDLQAGRDFHGLKVVNPFSGETAAG